MSPGHRVLEVVLIVDTSVQRARLQRVLEWNRDYPKLTAPLQWPLVGGLLVQAILWWARRGITFTHETRSATPVSVEVSSLDGHPKP